MILAEIVSFAKETSDSHQVTSVPCSVLSDSRGTHKENRKETR